MIHLLIVGVTLFMAFSACSTIGVNHDESTLKRLEQSPNYRGGKFHNLLETPTLVTSVWEVSKDAIFNKSDRATPQYIPEYEILSRKELDSLPDDQNYAIWLGHSSVLLKVQGKYILTDPIFSSRPSPVQFAGTKRFHPTPISAKDLPELDIVLISHDHYDHLDRSTIEEIKDKTKRFITPLAVGEYLKAWGVPDSKISELDWWEDLKESGFTITATPARHGSGRGLTNRYSTLWSGFAVHHPQFDFYYTGDTGMMPSFKEIGDKLGPFDLTLVQLGAYGDNWPLIHMTPEDGVQAHQDVQGLKMLPVHWGTFSLAFHAWDEPIIRARKAAEAQNVDMINTVPGKIIPLEQNKKLADAESLNQSLNK